MVINKLMWRPIFIILLYPCEVTDGLTDAIIDVGVDMLTDMGIIVMLTPTIPLEFSVAVACVVDVLTDLLTNLVSVLIIDDVTVIDVDMLADETFNPLMTPSEFTLSSSP